MSDRPKRTTTLVGIEPVRGPDPSIAVAVGTVAMTRPRTKTSPYGLPVVSKVREALWTKGRDPSLFGLFVSDGSLTSPARRSRIVNRSLPDHLFLPSSSAPPPTADHRSSETQLPAVGTVLEKYRLDELLGVGGFAAVYRATHLLLKRQVAVKLLKPGILQRKPELMSQLPREAELAARLDHPNVVRMIDVFHGASGTFLVMEYVEGSSLASLMRRRAITPKEVVDIGIDVVRGLRAGLEKGLIHRDIKPANIMVTDSGSAKIVDFGLALSFAGAGKRERSQVVGTRGYVAPEQLSHPETADFRADMFSLGATLYHAATGVAPFPVDDSSVGLGSNVYAPVPAPQRLAPGIPTALSRIIAWLLFQDRASRPASYERLESAMESARSDIAKNATPGTSQ